ncbi:hypothetical protein T484DRAFT_1939641 [Baffinella frigidus]|nr:hypothetical protein T484DRAFT_1939641 [Cryptophyta sp. CCMP2293]
MASMLSPSRRSPRMRRGPRPYRWSYPPWAPPPTACSASSPGSAPRGPGCRGAAPRGDGGGPRGRAETVAQRRAGGFVIMFSCLRGTLAISPARAHVHGLVPCVGTRAGWQVRSAGAWFGPPASIRNVGCAPGGRRLSEPSGPQRRARAPGSDRHPAYSAGVGTGVPRSSETAAPIGPP